MGSRARFVLTKIAMAHTAKDRSAMPRVRDPNVFMTINAQQALSFGAVLESTLKNVGQLYAVKVSTPEQSTGGGVRVLQHIRLVPIDGSSLVVGSFNTKDLTAELRGLSYVRAMNRQRFEGKLTLEDDAYVAFLERATALLTGLGFKVSVTEPPREMLEKTARIGVLSKDGAWWASLPAPSSPLVLATLLLACVGTWVLLH